MKLSELVGYVYYLWEAKSIWKKSKPWQQLSDVLETNSLSLMGVLKIFSEIFPYQIWQEIERNVNFKQWFNVFLVISEAWQGYELKAYGVSNHNLKRKFSRTRDIPSFPTQGWADTAFCMRNWSETIVSLKWFKLTLGIWYTQKKR